MALSFRLVKNIIYNIKTCNKLYFDENNFGDECDNNIGMNLEDTHLKLNFKILTILFWLSYLFL